MSVTTKIIGLASTLVAFAGIAFGQAATNLTCGPGTGSPASGASISPQVPIELRSEGATELVSDELIGCAAAPAGSTSGVVYATLSATGLQAITSKVLSTSTGITDATLIITTATPSTAYYQGTVSGTTITFGTALAPVTFPTVPFNMEISNVRVNVTGQWPNNLQPVTETVQLVAQGNGLAAVTTIPAQIVGNMRNSLSVTGVSGTSYVAPGSTTAGTAAGANGVSTPISYLVCNTGSNVSGATGFSFNIASLFAGAFKTKSQQMTASTTAAVFSVSGIPSSESGSYVQAAAGNGVLANTGAANFGTRFKLVFTNIPTNATVTLPITITNGNFQIQLTTGGETGALTLATTQSGVAAGQYALTATSGAATAIYEVTTTDVTNSGSFTVPVAVTYTANSVVPTTTPITVAVSYAASSATSVASGGTLASPIPTIPYFANTGTPLNGSKFAACQTTLLFPFVSNASLFETGLAISNTGADLLSTTSAGVASSSVTGQSGTCNLTFFSTGTTATNPVAYVTPAIPPGTTWANTLTSVTSANAIASGYVIAQCNFLFAHGFDYVTFNIGQSNAMAMGYLALEVDINRTASSGTPEQLLN